MLERLNTASARTESAVEHYDWDELVQDDRVHRLIYTDPAIFAAEMTHIFGAVWVYLGHESQIANKDDFITVRLGLRPIILLRDSQGRIRALFNRCTHRGTTLCRKDKGSARIFTCPYHGWSYLNTGKLRAVPWPDGYACDFNDAKFNVAQVPRVESYRGFIFATLNPEAPSLIDYLGAITKPIDEWLDRQPKGRIRVCEANRLKFKGNWKLAYDNSGDGYHVVFSHRSLLEMENRLADDANKGMSYYKGSPDTKPMYMAYTGNGHHFKDKRPNIAKRAGGLWAVEGPAPGSEHYAQRLRQSFGAKADVMFSRDYPATVNDPDATTLARRAATTVAGEARVVPMQKPTMGGEDFSFMLNAKQGSYIMLGGGRGKGDAMVHHPRYDFNDEVLPVGASYWATLAEQLLARG